MLRKNSTIWLTILMGFVILGLACDNAQVDEANKLINEANPLIDKSKPLSEKVTGLINDVMGSKMTQAEDIDQYRTDNKAKFDEIVSLSEQCEKNYSEAAAKFDQASTKKLDDKFKEYIGLKAQEFKKDAEKHKMTAVFIKAFLAEKDVAKADQSIADYNKKNEALVKEADELDAKAEKIVKDNPSLFNSK